MRVDFSRVLGQRKAKKILKKAVQRGRVSPVYLFFGPQGVGKASLAREFVKAVFCKSPEVKPCNRCNTCRRVEIFVHPDLWLLFPVKMGGEDKNIKRYWEMRGKLGDKNQTRPHGYDRTASISHQLIRMVQDEAGKHTYEAPLRFVVILDADRLTIVAQNNLLKILEENPTNTHFLLITTRSRALLPTILSRSQKVPFSSLRLDDFKRYSFPRDFDIEVIYRLSGGSIGKAREYLLSPLIIEREHLLKLIRDGDPKDFVGLFTKLLGDRSKMADLLWLFGSLLRDIFLTKLHLEGFLSNLDLREEIRTTARRITYSKLERGFSMLRTGEEGLSRNVNPDLLLASLLSCWIKETPQLWQH